jgi:hypothetical protein
VACYETVKISTKTWKDIDRPVYVSDLLCYLQRSRCQVFRGWWPHMWVAVKKYADICLTRKHSRLIGSVQKAAEFIVRSNVKVVPSVVRQSQVWRDK